LFFASIFGTMAFSFFFIGVPLFITEILDFNPEFIPLIFSVIAVVTLAGPFIAESIAARKGFGLSLFLTWLIVSIAMFVFAVPRALVWSIVGLGIKSIAEVVVDILEEAAMHQEFSSKLRASLGSVNSINWAITNSVGVFLAGLGIKFLGVLPVIYIAGIFAFITSLVYLFGLKD